MNQLKILTAASLCLWSTNLFAQPVMSRGQQQFPKNGQFIPQPAWEEMQTVVLSL